MMKIILSLLAVSGLALADTGLGALHADMVKAANTKVEAPKAQYIEKVEANVTSNVEEKAETVVTEVATKEVAKEENNATH
ncbi:MAG: Unknown protein [uncultured Sulfurovum sp.]|uniref:Uncharacterized protein n=1 Tax=uncultured Sulfurovum sp. TaxID=269237 RepID=A0A6S6SLA4_9BACT|nr:MAG: Unknown protein [uncultured Sulfurovum sp.]